jgi:hypothetical protein
MKWILLLATITACGKYTEPEKLDLHDSDGDQIQNYNESEFDKHIANFDSLGEVKGVIKFYNGKTHEISFSNNYDLKNRTIEMITGNEKQLRTEEYFTEWSKLQIEKVDVNYLQTHYEVSLEFESGSDKPDQIILTRGKEKTVLGDWMPLMKLTLSAKTLKDLFNGDSELVMIKKFRPSLSPTQEMYDAIREKTYRVFFNDGKSSKIYYVSKDLKFENFIDMKNIINGSVIDEDSLFFSSREVSETRWFLREFPSGDKVVVKNDINFLRERFLKRFDYQKSNIGRLNGTTFGSLKLQNKEGAKVYLRIKSFLKTKRTFVESREVRGSGGGGGREGSANGRCSIHRRLVQSENVEKLQIEDLAQEIISSERFVQTRLQVFSDDMGVFWELKLDPLDLNSSLMFKPLPQTTFTITGGIYNTCDDTIASQSTNQEGKLNLEIESYVEKID